MKYPGILSLQYSSKEKWREKIGFADIGYHIILIAENEFVHRSRLYINKRENLCSCSMY